MCSGVTAGGAQGPYVVLEIEPVSVTWNINILTIHYCSKLGVEIFLEVKKRRPSRSPCKDTIRKFSGERSAKAPGDDFIVKLQK